MLRSYYEVLGLSGPASSYTVADIKAAYKKALLLHHPDKSKDMVPAQSVDAITEAYKALSDLDTRSEHDRKLILQARQKLGQEGHTGLQIADLDDLDLVEDAHSPQADSWSKACRCGARYTVTEHQLEQEADKGELYIPCEGCSLWLKVLFQVSET